MGDAIAHRGPDGEGVFIDAGAPSVGIINRRLAVIDVDGGAQPITIEDGAFTIVYNGELFNTAPLRRELEVLGHRFRTQCDTEVVVRGYAQWGVEVLAHLDGMWAFAIWDRAARSLFLARDRLGIKPLVYSLLPGAVIFASEIKGLMASGLLVPELDPATLPHYLSAFAIPDPLSLFKGVRRLPAGHAMVLTADGPREFEYWDCSGPEEDDRGRAAYVEEVGGLLEDSVRRTMVSDVPLGVLLSGGIDSRLLATYAARTDPDLHTFTLGFDDAAFDERPAARAIAESLGTHHHEVEMDSDAGAKAYRRLVELYDEPGQSLIQTHFISEFARTEVTVALSGLGGDELFSAYPTHVATNVLARLDAVPAIARRAATALAALTPLHRLQRLAELSAMPADQRVTHELFHQTSAGLRNELLNPEVAAQVDLSAPVTYLVEHMARAQSRAPLNRLLYLYLKTYLPNELLRASDSMSMLSSLELRVPFLDHHLVERAMAIPVAHKMRFRQGKLLLRDIADQTLTDPTSHIKRGFSPPLMTWLAGELGEEIADTLTREAISDRGVFDPDAATRVVRRCLAGDRSLAPALMMLYSFEVWAQRWLGAPAAATAPVPELAVRPAVSVIIVSWNTLELTRAALQSLRDHFGSIPHEVVVVDNASTDGSQEMVEAEFPDVRLIKNSENVGFGRANNQGMGVARGAWFLLLNSDAALIDDSVATLWRRISGDRTLGIAHCRLISPDGSLQHTTYRFPSVRVAALDNLGLSRLASAHVREDLLGSYWDQTYERDVDSVAGAFMLLPRDVFEETRGFDERIFMYGEDIEWCYRIQQRGWRVRYFPDATVRHQNHASSDKWVDDTARVAIAIAAQREMVANQDGRLAAAFYMSVLVLGTSLRLVYYRARGRGSSGPSDRFRAMVPGYAALLRAQLSMLRRRP
jgi:asparagine synthase (glutamine-hydrolysing)